MRLMVFTIGMLVAAVSAHGGDETAITKELRLLSSDGISAAEQAWNLTFKDGAKFGGDSGKYFFLVLENNGSGLVRTDKDSWEVHILVDPGKKPKTMDIEHRSGPNMGKTQFAIYKLEKEKLTILATKPGAAAADRPASFEKQDARQTSLMVFDRKHFKSIE